MSFVRNQEAVYVYALEPAWRERLALPAPGLALLAPGEGLDADSWAANEFAGAALGDARLSARLVESAHHMAQSPMRAITGATHGARALVKGHPDYVRCAVERHRPSAGANPARQTVAPAGSNRSG